MNICLDCLKVPLIVGSCIAGIMGEAVYSPYDITGRCTVLMILQVCVQSL